MNEQVLGKMREWEKVGKELNTQMNALFEVVGYTDSPLFNAMFECMDCNTRMTAEVCALHLGLNIEMVQNLTSAWEVDHGFGETGMTVEVKNKQTEEVEKTEVTTVDDLYDLFTSFKDEG